METSHQITNGVENNFLNNLTVSMKAVVRKSQSDFTRIFFMYPADLHDTGPSAPMT